MPMEIFVSCWGDLATIGGLVVVVVVTPVLSPPASFSFFCCQTLGIRKYLSWQFPCTLAQRNFWRGGEVSRKARVGRPLSRHILSCSVSTLPGYSLQFTDLSLQFTVQFNLAPWTGNPPPE